jgi:hypothetical protein
VHAQSNPQRVHAQSNPQRVRVPFRIANLFYHLILSINPELTHSGPESGSRLQHIKQSFVGDSLAMYALTFIPVYIPRLLGYTF